MLVIDGYYIGSRGRLKLAMSNPSTAAAATSSKHISLPRIFSEGDPTEWFKCYEICCSANDWNDEMKVKKLPTLLEGEALVTWLELTVEQQASYDQAKKNILERMGPVWFVSMDDFHRFLASHCLYTVTN